MPPVVGAAIGAGASIYAANKSAKATSAAANTGGGGNAPVMTSGGSSRVGRYNNKGEWAYDKVTIDPRIRSLREQALGRLPEYRQGIGDAYGTLNNRLETTRGELASNENPFIQARVNPLLARAAEGRGQISRGMTRRGLGGSSLYSSGLGNYDAQVGREIGDQRSLATNEALASRIGMDTQIYNSAMSTLQAFQGLDSTEQSIAAQNLQEELASLGMNATDTGALLGAAGLNMQSAQLKNETYGRALDSVGRAIGGINFSSAPKEKYSAANPGAII